MASSMKSTQPKPTPSTLVTNANNENRGKAIPADFLRSRNIASCVSGSFLLDACWISSYM